MKQKIIAYILILTVALSINTPCNAAIEAQTNKKMVQSDSKAIQLGMNVNDITVPNGKGQLITLPAICKTVSVGNPLICDIVMLGERDFLLVGKQPGETNVYVWLENDMKLESTIKVFDSTAALIELLGTILPYEKEIKVSMAHNTVILSGYVIKPTSIEDAQKISEAYMAGRDTTKQIDIKVVNMLKVKDEKQIMLEVRFAEVIRTGREDKGIDWRYQGDIFGAPTDFSFLEGGTPAYNGGATAGMLIPNQNGSQGTSAGAAGWHNGQNQITYGLEWIESSGLGKIIAKPNLLVRNGEEASFLAGGEFPVPVQQENSVQIEWKEFGVKLSFRPFIDERDNIYLTMVPEVSVLDFSEASVSVNGFNIPALKTRRTETKVVLKEGQSFYVSGLISQSETDSFSKIPGIDSMPILGSFFRKKENNTSETELIIFVTPRIINPIAAAPEAKDFSDLNKMQLMTNSMPVPFEQAHGDAIKNFIEQNEKPDQSLEEIRQAEIDAEIARLLKEAEQAKIEKKNLKREKKMKKEMTVSENTSHSLPVEEIRNEELAKEHSLSNLESEGDKQSKERKNIFSLFKNDKKVTDEAEMSDILAADLENNKTMVTPQSLSIATADDITAGVSSGISYLDDISDELHGLSALKG